MTKALFLLFHGFEEANGISKKIRYQIKALKDCGLDVRTCYYEVNTASGHRRWMADDEVIADFGTGTVAKIKKRFSYRAIRQYVLREGITFVYIRSLHNANPFTIRLIKGLKRQGVKVVMEIPTYPYDQEYVTPRMKLDLFMDKTWRRRLARQLEAIVTFSDYKEIFGTRTIRISNGIDFEAIPLKQHKNDISKELHLLGVAEIHYWHGFDRLLLGLAEYYRTNAEYKVYFHIVGLPSGERERQELYPLIKQHGLEPYVILHGARHGKELDALFEQADFAIGSLGRHRSGITKIKTLKNREYAARGLAFIYSETDDDFEKAPYILKAPADESPIRIQGIIDFCRKQTLSPQEIRKSVEHLSWKCQMEQVLREARSCAHPLKIAYCLPSLYIPGGMERVLTIKANYFADVLGYDITLILTDGKGKEPFYKLSPRIKTVQLDVNFETLWHQPLHKKAFIFLQKQRVYKRRLTEALMQLRPDITVSMLRREINFIHSIADGSVKIGELHVNKSNYRNLGEQRQNIIKRMLSSLWMYQLNRSLKKLARFVILTHEDRENWSYLPNTAVIPNPLPFFPEEQSGCTNKEVIAVGRYVYQKGFDLLTEAWRIVAKRHPDWQLRIYGGGDRREFIRLKEKYGLTSLHLEEETTEITKNYCKSSIFVLSSRYEGFGMVITEAMACGVPPVSFACPCGPRDIIRDKEDGLLVENGNIEQLAEKICYLIEHEDVRKEMGKQARTNVERFRMEAIANQWKELFESAIKEGKQK